jgi:glycosyltransferase involved in cell wall biosynthesis
MPKIQFIYQPGREFGGSGRQAQQIISAVGPISESALGGPLIAEVGRYPEPADLFVVVGDISHVARFAQNIGQDARAAYVAYVSVDAVPTAPDWAKALSRYGTVVVPSGFTAAAIHEHNRDLEIKIIPPTAKGLGTPAANEVRRYRESLVGDSGFVIGTVAQNSLRKGLPRLLWAFRKFVNPAMACQRCGHVEFNIATVCPACESPLVKFFGPKKNAKLVIHSWDAAADDYPLDGLISRFRLDGQVVLSLQHLSDRQMGLLYRSFDVFASASGGEGFCTAMLEAAAAGVPLLVPHHGGQVDLLGGVSEFVSTETTYTPPGRVGDFFLPELDDFAMKLDRFYMERSQFFLKWRSHLMASGMEGEDVEQLHTGDQYRERMSHLACERGLTYAMDRVAPAWAELFAALLKGKS